MFFPLTFQASSKIQAKNVHKKILQSAVYKGSIEMSGKTSLSALKAVLLQCFRLALIDTSVV